MPKSSPAHPAKSQNATTDAVLLEQIRARASRFLNRDLAFGFAATTKPSRVMLGDDERFWVVRPVDAARMEAMGFEYAG